MTFAQQAPERYCQQGRAARTWAGRGLKPSCLGQRLPRSRSPRREPEASGRGGTGTGRPRRCRLVVWVLAGRCSCGQWWRRWGGEGVGRGDRRGARLVRANRPRRQLVPLEPAAEAARVRQSRCLALDGPVGARPTNRGTYAASCRDVLPASSPGPSGFSMDARMRGRALSPPGVG